MKTASRLARQGNRRAAVSAMRVIEGMITAARYAREGVFPSCAWDASDVMRSPGLYGTAFVNSTFRGEHPVIDPDAEHEPVTLGGTRLGSYPAAGAVPRRAWRRGRLVRDDTATPSSSQTIPGRPVARALVFSGLSEEGAGWKSPRWRTILDARLSVHPIQTVIPVP